MDRDALAGTLAETFESSAAERRVVVRQALDLADSGRWAETHDGTTLTPDRVVAELGQAPDDALADRWNWWMGSLEVAHGGFARFAVRRWEAE